MALFAPILNSSQPAFNYEKDGYNIHFRIPDKVSNNEIKHIGIRVIELNSNLNVVNLNRYPDGIIYKPITNSSSKHGYVTIAKREWTNNKWETDFIHGHWKKDTYYKVQLRFGRNALWEKPQDFISWKKKQVTPDEQGETAFSEWSTVMVIKAIQPPKIDIKNKNRKAYSGIQVIGSEAREYDSNALFEGVYSNLGEEQVSHYRFQLFRNEQLVEDSGWLMHDLANDISYAEKEVFIKEEDSDGIEYYKVTSGDQHRFKTALEYNPNDPIEYMVTFQVKTINQYELEPVKYNFQMAIARENPPINQAMIFEYEPDNEEGLVNLWLSAFDRKTDMRLSGNYIVSRTSEKSNFKVWEDIKYFTWTLENIYGDGEIIFTDYTIESGIQYQYAIQSQNSIEVRTERYLATERLGHGGTKAQVDFQHTYLYSKGIQLKIKYDAKMGSFKYTRQAAKQDTLGSQYPIIMQNAATKYAEFPVSGLISLHGDEAHQFFQLQERDNPGYYYKGELIIPGRKLEPSYRRDQVPAREVDRNDITYSGLSFGTNLTDDNFFIERVYREKVEEFLSDGEYKIFKSPSVGNFIVGLINVNLTPNEQLGKMIHSFSGTAYEVAEYTYDNISKYGIEDKGVLGNLSGESFYVLGQITPETLDWNWNQDSWGESNLIKVIEKQVKAQNVEAYQKDLYNFKLKNLATVWFEPYPDIDLTIQKNTVQDAIETRAEELGKNYLEDPVAYDTLEANDSMLKQLKAQLARYDALEVSLRQPAINHKFGIQFGPTKTNIRNFYLGYNQKLNLGELNKSNDDSDPINWIDGELNIIPQKVKEEMYYPPILLNYIAEVELIENEEELVTDVKSLVAYGQIEGVFLDMAQEDQKNYYEAQSSLNIKLPITLYDTLDIGKKLESKIRIDAGNAYLLSKEEENNVQIEDASKVFTKYLEEEYAFTTEDGKAKLDILGYEAIEIEADPGTIFKIWDYPGKYDWSDRDNPVLRDCLTIVIGPTGKYVLKFTELSQIQDIELQQSAHCLINYYAQVKIEEKGGSKQK